MPHPPPSLEFCTVCSGIESASLAWMPLGMKPLWFSEIEPFANALLSYRYPSVPNLGGMRSIAQCVLNGNVPAPAILAGGTPCQSFSLAGPCKGMADPRGALTLSFVELANALDKKRQESRLKACIIVWENVPGVLTSRDNSFGHYLAALAGESAELEPPGYRWTDAGCVYGPQRAIAWRVLDAQYFGLAQRRKRVFVVASARTDLDPATILFEREGLRRDLAPSRRSGQDAASHVARGFASCGPWSAPQCCGGVVRAFGGGRGTGPVDVSPTLLAHTSSPRCDFESDAFIAKACRRHLQEVSHTLRAEGFDASEDGAGRGTPLVPLCMSFDTTQITSPYNYSAPTSGQPCHPLLASAHPPTIVLQSPQEEARWSCRPFSVRRLTPRECERLQGLPDNYTLIPYGRIFNRRKNDADWLRYQLKGQVFSAADLPRFAADGPRYRAIGNSIAVPCLAWLGDRLLLAAC